MTESSGEEVGPRQEWTSTLVVLGGLLIVISFNVLFLVLLWRRNSKLQKQVDHLKRCCENTPVGPDTPSKISLACTSTSSDTPKVTSRSPSHQMPPRAQSLTNNEDSMRHTLKTMYDTIGDLERRHFGFTSEIRSRIQTLESHCGILARSGVQASSGTAHLSSPPRMSQLLVGMPQPTLKGARTSPTPSSVFALPINSPPAALATSQSPLPVPPGESQLDCREQTKCVLVERNPNESMRLSAPFVHHACFINVDDTAKVIVLSAVPTFEQKEPIAIERRPLSSIFECVVGGTTSSHGGFEMRLRFAAKQLPTPPPKQSSSANEWWLEDNSASPVRTEVAKEEWWLLLDSTTERAGWIQFFTKTGVRCVIDASEVEATPLD